MKVGIGGFARGAGLLALVAGTACAPARAAAPAAPVPIATVRSDTGSARLLYVCNEEGASVTLVDMDANEVVGSVDLTALGFSPNAKPHDVAVEPDGSFWYVSLIGDGVVLKLDRRNRLVGRAPFEAPGMLALDAPDDRLFVGRSMKAVNPPPRIGRIERSEMEIEEVDVFFPRPHGLALDAARDRVYAASMSVNQVAEVDAVEGEVELVTLPGPHDMVMHFALSPDGRTLVGTADHTGMVMVLDATAPDLTPIASVDVGGAPWEPAFTPDGRHVYVALKRANAVAVLDASSWAVVATILGEGISEPQGIAVSPDGRWVYVSSNNVEGGYASIRRTADGGAVGTVTVIDAATRRIVKVLEAGAKPTGLGALPPG